MKIYVEVVVIVAIIVTYLFVKAKLERGRKKALKQYNPEKDMSGEVHKLQLENGKNKHKGGVFDTGADENADSGIDTVDFSSVGLEQPEGRELLSTTDVSNAREDSTSTRKNSSSIRKRLFGRRTKKN